MPQLSKIVKNQCILHQYQRISHSYVYVVQLWRIEHAPVHERVHIMWVDTDRINTFMMESKIRSLHCSFKETIGHLPQHMSCVILCFSSSLFLLRSYDLTIFHRLTSIIVACDEYEMQNINYMHSKLQMIAGGSVQVYH